MRNALDDKCFSSRARRKSGNNDTPQDHHGIGGESSDMRSDRLRIGGTVVSTSEIGTGEIAIMTTFRSAVY
jgi:hypothetical protein